MILFSQQQECNLHGMHLLLYVAWLNNTQWILFSLVYNESRILKYPFHKKAMQLLHYFFLSLAIQSPSLSPFMNNPYSFTAILRWK